MKKNLLIVTHFFEKDGVIGSVRWTNFAHRLSNDYNVFILTHGETINGKGFRISKSKEVSVIEVDNLAEYIKRSQTRHKEKQVASMALSGCSIKTKMSLRTTVKAFLKSILQTVSIKKTARKNCKILNKFCKDNKVKFDYVISTSRPFINSYTAKYLTVKHKAKWILDQRDLPLTETAHDVEFKWLQKEFKKLDKYVFKYTIVSKGMKEGLAEFYDFTPAMMDKVYVLYNGYTQEDKVREQTPISIDKLTFAFTGDLYAGKRDLTMLLDAIYRLINKNLCRGEDFVIHYAGGAVESLEIQARAFNLVDIIANHGRIPHRDAVQLQNSCDILLLPTWNTQRNQGILTGKIYEYMLAEKPIISITAGDLPQGEATQTIKELNLGLAVEMCDYENGIKLLEEYILMQLTNKKQGKGLLFNPDILRISKFDYDNLVEELKDILTLEEWYD